MKIHVLPHTTEQEQKFFSAWYQCVSCKSTSPRFKFPISCATSEIKKATLEVALYRVEPKNRVLTLEEVKNAEMDTFHNVMHWLELKQPEDSEIRYGVLGASMFLFDEKIEDDLDVIFTAAGMGEECRMKQKEYCKYWRCWLRKPTNEEMEGTPWA
jgi:hypothetical protein